VDGEGEAALISFGKRQTAKSMETGRLTRGESFLLSVNKPKCSAGEVSRIWRDWSLLFPQLPKTEIRRNAAYNVLDKSFDGSNPENLSIFCYRESNMNSPKMSRLLKRKKLRKTLSL